MENSVTIIIAGIVLWLNISTLRLKQGKRRLASRRNITLEWICFALTVISSGIGIALPAAGTALAAGGLLLCSAVQIINMSPAPGYISIVKSALDGRCSAESLFLFIQYSLSMMFLCLAAALSILMYAIVDIGFLILVPLQLYYLLIGVFRTRNLFPLARKEMMDRITASLRRGCSPDLSQLPIHPTQGNTTDANVYERIREYIVGKQAFLDHDLTLDNVAKHLYTNKSYISKGIRNATGETFCGYVNSFRIAYALENFKKDPSLRVSQLAEECGFNTAAAFTTAFKMIMNTTPSKWCAVYKDTLRV